MIAPASVELLPSPQSPQSPPHRDDERVRASASTRFRFTVARLEALPIPLSVSQRPTYHDTDCPGLSLRVSSGGTKTFQVYKRLKNHSCRRMVIGKFPQLTPDDARKAAWLLLADVARGEDPNQLKRAVRSETTIGELFPTYMEVHAKPHKRTWHADEHLFARFCRPWFARRLSEITTADVQTWHARIGTATGECSANRAHSLLRKLFNFAVTRGYAGGNPARGIQRFREHSRERFLDRLEMPCFLAAVDGDHDPQARAFVLLALLTGGRRSNVLGMRWDEIDLERRLWRIPDDRSKNGRAMEVVLVPEAVALLTERRHLARESPWVFPGSASADRHYAEPKRAWTRILRRAEVLRLVELLAHKRGNGPAEVAALLGTVEAEFEALRVEALSRRLGRGSDYLAVGIERLRERARSEGVEVETVRYANLRIHDLRRTNGSWQAAAGASLSVIGKSLGHRHVSTTAIYARLDLDPVRSSVEQATANMRICTPQR